MERIENRMVVDSEWGEIEYGIKHRNTYQRRRQAMDEAEREETDYGFAKRRNGCSKPAGRHYQL